MTTRKAKAFFSLCSAVALAAAAMSANVASASCDIHNDTKYSFTVESGNTSNQSVGSHTSTSIADGKIVAKSSEGKSFGGSCKKGDKLEVKEENGVVIMTVK